MEATYGRLLVPCCSFVVRLVLLGFGTARVWYCSGLVLLWFVVPFVFVPRGTDGCGCHTYAPSPQRWNMPYRLKKYFLTFFDARANWCTVCSAMQTRSAVRGACVFDSDQCPFCPVTRSLTMARREYCTWPWNASLPCAEALCLVFPDASCIVMMHNNLAELLSIS